MRKSIEEALEPMIADSKDRLPPIDYLRYIATMLEIVQNGLTEAENAEHAPLSLVERTKPIIQACIDALYEICDS